MKINLNKQQANALFVILVIVVLGFVIFATYYMISNREAFTTNPLIYGAEKMNLGECYCNCYDNVNAQPISFYFNSTSFSQSWKEVKQVMETQKIMYDKMLVVKEYAETPYKIKDIPWW